MAKGSKPYLVFRTTDEGCLITVRGGRMHRSVIRGYAMVKGDPSLAALDKGLRKAIKRAGIETSALTRTSAEQ